MGNYQKKYGQFDTIDIYVNKAVSQILKESRKEKKWSYEELSNRMNNVVTRQTLNNYELGKTKLRHNIFKEIAKVYNIPPNELFDKINLRYIKLMSEADINNGDD